MGRTPRLPPCVTRQGCWHPRPIYLGENFSTAVGTNQGDKPPERWAAPIIDYYAAHPDEAHDLSGDMQDVAEG